MKEPLGELYREVAEVTHEMKGALEGQRWSSAREYARRLLSAGSKLHARCSLLAELADEAQWVAEVDRALAKERKTRPEAVAGDQPLPFSAKSPRGRKGSPPTPKSGG